MKRLYKRLLYISIACLIFSCSSNDDEITPIEKPWNKSKTADIVVYSHLSGLSLFAANNYAEVVSSLKQMPHAIALLDRTNVSYGNSSIVNTATRVAAESGEVPIFVPISYGDKKYVGSTVLLKHTLTEAVQHKVVDFCRLLEVKTEQSNSYSMLFTTLSMTDKAQIKPAVATIKDQLKEETVIVGVVKRDLLTDLRTEIENQLVKDSYSYEEVENADSDLEYCIYILTSDQWKFRGVTERPVTNDIHSYLLKIESFK